MRRILACTLLAFLPMVQAGGNGAALVCTGAPRMDIAGIQKRLTAAEAKWAKSGPQHYQLNVVTHSFFSNLEIQVHVERQIGAVAQSLPPTARPGERPRVLASVDAASSTVPGLFTQVADLINRSQLSGGCGTFEVSFDPANGALRSVRYFNARETDSGFSMLVSPIALLP